MKTASKIIAIALVIATCLAACKKENTNNGGDSYASVQSFFSQNKVQAQTFTVNATNGGTITGAKGSKVTFQPYAFVRGNGTTVTGNVTITLKEVFSKKDMIFEGVFPRSNGELLNSAGEYFLGATENGVQVNIRKGHFFEMRLPAQQVDPNMQFFMLQGEGDSAQWIIPDTAVVQVDSQWVVTPVNGFAFNLGDSTYVISSDSLTWANADVFMNPTYVDCSFKVQGVNGFSNSNSTAYCVYDGYNTVWASGINGWGTIANNTITDSHIASIPVHFLVISVIDGELYAGSTAVTPTNGGIYNVTIAPITKTELDALILSFN